MKVTDEMIEAGAEANSRLSGDATSAEEYYGGIYLAMEAAREPDSISAREAFERWYKAEGITSDNCAIKDAAWGAWQGRASSPAQPEHSITDSTIGRYKLSVMQDVLHNTLMKSVKVVAQREPVIGELYHSFNDDSKYWEVFIKTRYEQDWLIECTLPNETEALAFIESCHPKQREPKLKAQSSSPAGYFAFDDDNNVWEEVMGADSPGAVPLYHANYIDLLPETHTTRCFKCGYKTTVKLSYANFPAEPAEPKIVAAMTPIDRASLKPAPAQPVAEDVVREEEFLALMVAVTGYAGDAARSAAAFSLVQNAHEQVQARIAAIAKEKAK